MYTKIISIEVPKIDKIRKKESPADSGPSIAFFSGGTALNSLVKLIKNFTNNVSYIIPTSDNGGSTYEITRVLGGPAIGDIRSRLIRLADDGSEVNSAIKKLLSFRLHSKSKEEASKQWKSILDMSHDRWNDVDRKHASIIKASLHYFDKRINQMDKNFDLRNGSIGNFYFSGARMFYRSIESAIFLFSKVVGISDRTEVLPAITSDLAYTIAAKLEDGTTIYGQNDISHPGRIVQKDYDAPLPSPIKEIFYVNKHNKRVTPAVNKEVLESLENMNNIVFSIGSTYTSIVPNLILKGVGETIASNSGNKIFTLNGHNDRETHGMSAIDYVSTITSALNRYGELQNSPQDYITHLIIPRNTDIVVNEQKLINMGIKPIYVESQSIDGKILYDKNALLNMIKDITTVE